MEGTSEGRLVSLTPNSITYSSGLQSGVHHRGRLTIRVWKENNGTSTNICVLSQKEERNEGFLLFNIQIDTGTLTWSIGQMVTYLHQGVLKEERVLHM